MLDHLPLSKQLEMVFREIKDELAQLTSGIVFIQIRNNCIGKFGVKHDTIESNGGGQFQQSKGLSDSQQLAFRRMAVESLRHKIGWTHGEILFEFALKKDIFCSSVQFESSYNMANLLSRRSML